MKEKRVIWEKQRQRMLENQSKKTSKEMGVITDGDGYLIVPNKENRGEDVYYHITTEECMEKIVGGGRLCGSKRINRMDGNIGSKRSNQTQRGGKLWVVNCDLIEVWNSISNNEVHKTKLDIFGRDGKPFYVIGILKSTFDKYGLTIQPNTDIVGETTTMFEREIYMGNKTIPINELIFCGRYITDSDRWECEDRWLLNKLITENQTKEEYDITKLNIYTPLLGRVSYEERYEKTMKKKFPTEQSKLDYLNGENIDKEIKEYQNFVDRYENHYRNVG